MHEPLRVCVLGAGVVGLHAAVRLQRDFPAAEVTVVAAGQAEQTTSIGAAGFFRPGFFNTAQPPLASKIIDESWQYYRALLASDQAASAGIIEVSGYFFTRGAAAAVANSHLERNCPDYRAATPRELQLCPGDWKHGVFCTTLVADDTYQLSWLTARFREGGGQIVSRKVDSFGELEGYDIIVNCTGLGSRQLCGDRRLVALRGQVFKVKAPWVKTFFYGDDCTYIIPGVDYVTLGGTRQFQDYSLQTRIHDSQGIWERCCAMVPSLRRAEVVREWVGLRPQRDPVRLEKQRLDSGVCVLHCYGHGGYGVMTAPGSAAHVSRMLTEVLRGDYSNPTASSM